MKLGWSKWVYGLASGAISGLANSLLSALGVGAANGIGVNVPTLDLKQLAIITMVGGAIGAGLYLKQSPVPPDEEEPKP